MQSSVRRLIANKLQVGASRLLACLSRQFDWATQATSSTASSSRQCLNRLHLARLEHTLSNLIEILWILLRVVLRFSSPVRRPPLSIRGSFNRTRGLITRLVTALVTRLQFTQLARASPSFGPPPGRRAVRRAGCTSRVHVQLPLAC